MKFGVPLGVALRYTVTVKRPRRTFFGHSSETEDLEGGCVTMHALLHTRCTFRKKFHATITGIVRKSLITKWSQLSDLNRRPTVYKTVALPLS
jgi:hypothetical protein